MAVLVNQFLVAGVEGDAFFVLQAVEESNGNTIALKSEVKMPMISVVANPRIAPLPKE